MAIWPLIQIIKYEMPVGNVFHEEVVVWIGPTELGARPYFEIPIKLILAGGAWGLPALLAPFVILFSRKERATPAVREIAIVSLAVIGLEIVSNFRHVRYAIPIIPSLSFLLAVALHRFLEQGRVVRVRTAAALIVLLSAGLVHAKIKIELRQREVANEKLIAETLGALQQAGTQTVLIESLKPGEDLLWDSFYLFHGNFRFPLTKYTVDQFRQNPPKPPLIGACVARDFPVVRQIYPDVQVQLTRAQFVCWRVSNK
jgi:hypothetical protein